LLESTAPPLIYPVDGLRAIAIIAVFIFHLQSSWLPGGLAGVDIFFVISGFVVTRSMMSRSHAGFAAMMTDFYARRFQRIMPPLVVMLLATSLAYCLFVPDAWLSGTIKITGRAAFLGLSNIVLGNNSDTYFSPGTALNPFTHTWSLGVEEQFYLLFPFLFAGWRWTVTAAPPRHTGTWAIFAIAVFSLLACTALAFHDKLLAFYSIASRFWELGTGMLLCLSMPNWQGRLAAAGGLTARVYARSKIACLMFALELEARSVAAEWKISSIAAHPGVARTELLHNGPGRGSMQSRVRSLLPFLFQPAAQGALPLLFAATSLNARAGGYYGPDRLGETRGHPAEAKIPPQALDDAAMKQLWTLSEDATGVRF
jgi:peptidoglycan/LPS O-acetylase OafA/YrhL